MCSKYCDTFAWQNKQLYQEPLPGHLWAPAFRSVFAGCCLGIARVEPKAQRASGSPQAVSEALQKNLLCLAERIQVTCLFHPENGLLGLPVKSNDKGVTHNLQWQHVATCCWASCLSINPLPRLCRLDNPLQCCRSDDLNEIGRRVMPMSSQRPM